MLDAKDAKVIWEYIKHYSKSISANAERIRAIEKDKTEKLKKELAESDLRVLDANNRVIKSQRAVRQSQKNMEDFARKRGDHFADLSVWRGEWAENPDYLDKDFDKIH